MPYDPNNPTGAASMSHVGDMKQTHTGVNNSYGGRKPGLEKNKIMISYGVYETRVPALNCYYHGYDENGECEHPFKAKVTCPEKWLDNPTPVSTLKAFFMKAYRKKFPDARLSKTPDEQIEVAIKDESMFTFSKQPVKEDAIIHKTFYDRQDVAFLGPEDWQEMDAKLKEYRRVIVRYLAHCHRSETGSWEDISPVTSARQLAPTNCYVVFTGWYKMQCVMVQPHFTIADLKVYLHEKNGSRMPLECIDIGLRSGDDIAIIDDALTLQMVYEKTQDPSADLGTALMTGPNTYGEWEEKEKQRKADEKERRRLEELEAQCEAEIEKNKDKRGPDARYFKRHDTTSRVHAEWDAADSKIKTFAIDDQPHSKAAAETGDLSDVIGPQKPMHLRTTHKPKDGKYAHLTKDGEYAETPRIKGADEDEDGDPRSRIVEVEDVPESSADAGAGASESVSALLRRLNLDRYASIFAEEDLAETSLLTSMGSELEGNLRQLGLDESAVGAMTAALLPPAGAAQETLAGLEPEPKAPHVPLPVPPPPKPSTALAAPSFMGKTLVLGVGKRIQDEKHKIWVASVHDPYSFRGPEDRAAGGGQKNELALQQNGAPKGWSAPAVGEASVNQDENCSIM